MDIRCGAMDDFSDLMYMLFCAFLVLVAPTPVVIIPAFGSAFYLRRLLRRFWRDIDKFDEPLD